MAPLLLTYKEKIKRLSSRIVEAQKPIRILDSVKLPPHVSAELRKSNFKELPVVLPEHYEKHSPIEFDADAKRTELREIIRDVQSELGEADDIGRLLVTQAEEYLTVIDLLKNRGRKEFWEYSRKLYGSPKDRIYNDTNTISDLGRMMYGILSNITSFGEEKPKEDLTAVNVVDQLNERFQAYFPDGSVSAKLSDGIIADASAGGDTVKIRSDSMFSARDVGILEVHEGWVHVGTTQNGANQKIAKWLSKGSPRCASTQEGLAVIMEIFSFRSYPKRAKTINDRIIAIEKAEEGADLLEMIEFYRTEGYSEEDCLQNAKRIFRGGTLSGGAPFTKDISYCKGFIENYNFMRSAIRAGKPELLPFLFVGKMHVDDVPLLYQKHKEGIIDAPKYLPPLFQDLNGLSVWMSFSNFLNVVNMKKVSEHYDRLFNLHL
ncbi:MAG: DUF1704 domain-containing protein [Cryobacterium sp.]|nr:DUF1704 domain-containing protein [Oligoflexia bacterium]